MSPSRALLQLAIVPFDTSIAELWCFGALVLWRKFSGCFFGRQAKLGEAIRPDFVPEKITPEAASGIGVESTSRIPISLVLEKRVRAAARNMAEAVAAPNPALWLAAVLGKPEEARQLLLGGANTEERGGIAPAQSTPLHVAVQLDEKEVVQLLLENSADVSVIHAQEVMPLHSAVTKGNEAVALLLLQHGADVSARNNHGVTPLDTAVIYGDEALARLFLQHGADTSSTDDDGRTSLHWAAHHGHVAAVQALIEHRANVSAKSHTGLTAEDLATSQSHPQVVAILQAEAVTRAKCVAFAMGHHTRLGVGSRLEGLHPEVLRMVLKEGGWC